MKNVYSHLVAALMVLMPVTGFTADDPATAVNGEVPVGMRYTLALEENLRVGPDKGDNFLWTQVGTSVQADGRGYMYVTGPGENRITVLNPDGDFVRHLGQPGQGPGEYQGLVSFQILADGRGVAFETRGVVSSLNWYDNELNFVEQTELRNQTKIYQSANLTPDGAHIFSQSINLDQAAGKMTINWGITDREGTLKTNIAGFDNPFPTPEIMKSADAFAKFLSQALTAEAKGLVGFAAFDSESNVYTATAGNYKITRWDNQMNKRLTISRKYKPIILTEEEIEAVISPIVDVMRAKLPQQMAHLFAESTVRKAVEMAEFPPAKHPIGGLALLDDGILGVLHHLNLVEKKMTLDLFDKQGRYLGDFTQSVSGVNSWALVFKQGHLYRIEANQDDENELVRYRYKLVPAG